MKVDYQMQHYDVTTNPRWRTAVNMKKLSQHSSGINDVATIRKIVNDPITMKFGTMNDIETMLRTIDQN